MDPKPPWHTPRWRDVDGVKAEEVKALREQPASAAAGGDDDAWRRTWAALGVGLLDDGVVADARVRQGGHPWGGAAAALREETPGKGWEPYGEGQR